MSTGHLIAKTRLRLACLFASLQRGPEVPGQADRRTGREKKPTRRSFPPATLTLLSLPLRSLFEGFPIVSVLWTNGFPRPFQTSLSDGCKQLWGNSRLGQPKRVLRFCRPGSKAGTPSKGVQRHYDTSPPTGIPLSTIVLRVSPFAGSISACSFERFGPCDGFVHPS